MSTTNAAATRKVYELLDGENSTSYGLFASRQLVEAELVRLALDGDGLQCAAIHERDVEGGPLDAEHVLALQMAEGPWHAGGGRIITGSGGEFKVECGATTIADDEIIAAAIALLVNQTMERRWLP